jgi:hypothetical protein
VVVGVAVAVAEQLDDVTSPLICRNSLRDRAGSDATMAASKESKAPKKRFHRRSGLCAGAAAMATNLELAI